MNNCIDYLRWRGDLSFEVSPLNEVDLGCLALLFVLHFDGIIPETEEAVSLYDAIDRYFEQRPGKDAGSELGVFESPKAVPLARELRSGTRFSEATVCGYKKKIRESRTEQFGAVSVDLPSGIRVIIYLSTDDTIIGWKEDFLLSVTDHLPAQKDALRYLNKFGRFPGRLILAGHSKGGNLSVYSSIFTTDEIQDRILRTVSFDGPGFSEEVLSSPGYERISRKIMSFRTQDSVIGMLLNTAGKTVTVRSCETGLIAHDLFTWDVRRINFVRVLKMSPFSIKFDQAIDAALNRRSPQEREQFIDSLFDLLSYDGAKTLTEIKKAKLFSHLETAGKLKEKPEVTEVLMEVLGEYLLPDGIRRIRERHSKRH